MNSVFSEAIEKADPILIVSHANDSYFWVIANFAGLDVNTTLKVYSSSTLVMGIVVFICVWGASLFLL